MHDLKKFNEEFDKFNMNEVMNTEAYDFHQRFLLKNADHHGRILFATNGDIVPNSPLLMSIQTYMHVAKDDLLCIPGKNVVNNMPIFGMHAFMMIIDYAVKHDYEYVIYVDADCFIWSTDNLMKKFSEFTEGDYIIGGVPDGGVFCHRNANNYCINPFLTFFNIRRLKRHFA